MSRIGKQPISIPSGLDVSLNGVVLVFKKGNATKELDTKGNVNVEVIDALNSRIVNRYVHVDK